MELQLVITQINNAHEKDIVERALPASKEAAERIRELSKRLGGVATLLMEARATLYGLEEDEKMRAAKGYLDTAESATRDGAELIMMALSDTTAEGAGALRAALTEALKNRVDDHALPAILAMQAKTVAGECAGVIASIHSTVQSYVNLADAIETCAERDVEITERTKDDFIANL